jgi:nucleotide-binding universal stress UspA family protein
MTAMSARRIERILVGLDGSAGSAAALEWAIGLAQALGAEVVAVHAFEMPYPVLAPAAGGASLGVGAEVESAERSLRDAVRETFRTEWCGPLVRSGVKHQALFSEGRAGPVLVEAAQSRDVDLVVTGRRGIGAIAELFAGSVSQYLVHRAARPVLVIPTPGAQPEPEPA